LKFAPFEYLAPTTPQAVVELLALHGGDAKLLAGGQSLLPTMAFRLAQPVVLVDLGKVVGLRHITLDASHVVLGAGARWCDVELREELKRAHPLLVEAVRHVAHYAIRNRGTVGGSLAHADPAAELPCIAVTCDARLRLLGPKGERTVEAAEFFTGALSTVLGEDELILSMQMAAWPHGRRWAFREFARRAGDFALAGVALYFDVDGDGLAIDAHLGAIGSSRQASRLPGAEALLNGSRLTHETAIRVAQQAFSEFEPADDHHAQAGYRRSLFATLVERALDDAMTRPIDPLRT
jgi:carbon-monoxide dehydrogenase medium subunit